MKEEYTWFPLSDCIPQLERFRYATFAHPEHSLERPERPSEGTIRSLFGNFLLTTPFKGPSIHVSEELLNEVMVIYSMQQDTLSVGPITVSC